MAVSTPLPVIFGCQGAELTADERALFQAHNPLGFILFGRNVVDPAQVKSLIAALRESVGRADAPVLIDQEGGRVARLRPPHWRAAPPAGRIGALVEREGIEVACEAARINSRLLANELAALGIDVDCAPVADVPVPDAHDIIGDRAYAADPVLVGRMARAAAQGLLDGGVLPVVKHIPGHGRARADSHEELPVVEDSRTALERSDFAPFRVLADMPWAMTAHVLYTSLDRDNPATTSRKVIAEIIRGHIGFDGVLVSDDLSMKALKGDLPSRGRAALEAGCDVLLHCTGNFAEMQTLVADMPHMTERALERVTHARKQISGARPAFDPRTAEDRLNLLLGVAA
jgi:beta-N-acetylhexosaminidase